MAQLQDVLALNSQEAMLHMAKIGAMRCLVDSLMGDEWRGMYTRTPSPGGTFSRSSSSSIGFRCPPLVMLKPLLKLLHWPT